MKRYFKGGLVLLFLLFVLLGTVTIHTVIRAQSYGKLVNYVGIVRGASQKLVKLELAHEPNNELINYLDEILEELLTGNGPYDLPLVKDGDYRLDLENLNEMWKQMKESIMEFRQGTLDGNELLELSEDYFTQANETVFSADRYSSAQIRMLSSICIGMFATMLLVWGLLFLALSRKVTFLESENKQLSDLTRRDPLTGIYQYESFREKAQHLLEHAEDKKYAVVYTDFTDFKYINDTCGHPAGDHVLVSISGILSETFGPQSLIGRIGGDEFAVYLPQAPEKNSLCRRLSYALTEISGIPLDNADHICVTCSVGVTRCTASDTVPQIYQRADTALYASKRAGKNQYTFGD